MPLILEVILRVQGGDGFFRGHGIHEGHAAAAFHEVEFLAGDRVQLGVQKNLVVGAAQVTIHIFGHNGTYGHGDP